MSEATDIERFAALLDETGPGRHHRQPEDATPDLLALLGVTRQLARAELPTVRPEFGEKLLADLMAAWETDGPTSVNAPAQALAAAQDDQVTVAWPLNGVPLHGMLVNGVPANGVLAPRPRRSPDGATHRDAMADPMADTVTNPMADTVTDTVADPRPAKPAEAVSNAETQVIRTVRSRRGPRTRIALVVGLAAGTLAMAGVSMASTDAQPGDPLYSVKGWGEQAQLLFAGSDTDRGRLHLDFARVRLAEAGGAGDDAVAGVLDDMDREITEGARLIFTAAFATGDTAAIDGVTAFVKEHRAGLTVLRTQLTVTGDPTAASLQLLTEVETRANELEAALAEGCTTTTTPDELGPHPTC